MVGNLLVCAGIGLPTLLHAQVGFFPMEDLSVEARYANTVFNHMVGVGATSWVGEGNQHFLVSVEGMVNPVQEPFSLRSGGDRMGAYVGLYGGYGYVADSGFLARVLVGGLFYHDGGFALGPDATAGLGWTF